MAFMMYRQDSLEGILYERLPSEAHSGDLVKIVILKVVSAPKRL